MLNQFRRNSAMYMMCVSSTIMLVSLVYPLTTVEQGALNALTVVVAGAIVGWTVAADGGLAVVVGIAKAIIALALAFGAHMAPTTQSVVMTAVAAFGAVFVHSNVTASVNAAGNTVTVDHEGAPVAGPKA